MRWNVLVLFLLLCSCASATQQDTFIDARGREMTVVQARAYVLYMRQISHLNSVYLTTANNVNLFENYLRMANIVISSFSNENPEQCFKKILRRKILRERLKLRETGVIRFGEIAYRRVRTGRIEPNDPGIEKLTDRYAGAVARYLEMALEYVTSLRHSANCFEQKTRPNACDIDNPTSDCLLLEVIPRK